MKFVATLLAKLTKQTGFTLKKALCLQADFSFNKVLRFQIKYVWLVSAGFGKLTKAPQIKISLGLGLTYDKVFIRAADDVCNTVSSATVEYSKRTVKVVSSAVRYSFLMSLVFLILG